MKSFLKTFVFIIPLALTSCVQTESKSLKSQENTQISYVQEHSYSEIYGYKISWSQVFEIDMVDYYVYFYSKTCSHCQKLKNYVIETALKTNCIFFVEASEDVVIKNSAKHQFYLSSAEIFSISGYPSMVQITNGICVKNVSGEDKILIILNFLNEVFE